jgi:hypothetical protein
MKKIHKNIPVSTSDNFGVGALSIAIIEHINSSLNVLWRRILREKVLSQTSCIGTSNTLTAHIAS